MTYPPDGLHSYGEPWGGYPHRCTYCGEVGMAVTEEPQCSGRRDGQQHPWADMTPLAEADAVSAVDLVMR